MNNEKNLNLIKSALTQALSLGLFKSFADVQSIMVAVNAIECELKELEKLKAEVPK